MIDGILETEGDFDEEFFQRHRLLCFIFDRECDMIYVSSII